MAQGALPEFHWEVLQTIENARMTKLLLHSYSEGWWCMECMLILLLLYETNSSVASPVLANIQPISMTKILTSE